VCSFADKSQELFEVFTTVVMKSIIFWDITQCTPLKATDVSEEHIVLATFHAGFLPGPFFGPEDGGDMFLRNVG
jgi:hypothetical protein